MITRQYGSEQHCFKCGNRRSTHYLVMTYILHYKDVDIICVCDKHSNYMSDHKRRGVFSTLEDAQAEALRLSL